MKRIILSLGVLFTSVVPTLAYYDSYSSSPSFFDVILWLIVFIFGILQIILFFKVWGMTNDIKSIKDKYFTPIEKYNPTLTYFGIKALKGKEAANNYLLEEILKVFSTSDTSVIRARKDYDIMLDTIKNKFQLVLNDAGLDFPDMEDYLSLISPKEYKGFKIGDKVKRETSSTVFVIEGFDPNNETARVEDDFASHYDFKVDKLKKKEE